MVWPSAVVNCGNCDTTMSACGMNGGKSDELLASALYDNDDGLVEVALECNYEKNCTPLYKRIENEDWPVVASFLDTGYWPNTFFPDKLTPSEQVKTWVTRFEKGGIDDDEEEDEKIKWSQLPLHLAIVVDAPLGIVRRLVEHYPRGVQCTDDERMLPLHLALRQGSPDEIVDFLLKVFPEAVNARGKNKRTAVECAMRGRRKARARIIQTFLDQSKSYETKELSEIVTRLEDRNQIIDELQSQLNSIEGGKLLAADGGDLAGQITRLSDIKNSLEVKLQTLEQSMENKTFLAMKEMEAMEAMTRRRDLEVSKQIDALEESAREMEEAERQIREQEEELRASLERIEGGLARSFSEHDLQILKKEAEYLKSDRLKSMRARTLKEMENLKNSLIKSLENPEGHSSEEIRAIQQAVAALESQELKAHSSDQLRILRDDLIALKSELRAKREISRAKTELMNLKNLIYNELSTPHGKEDEEVKRLSETVEQMRVAELDSKTSYELLDIRKELAIMKKKVQERQLMNELQTDLDELVVSVTRQLEASTGDRKRGLWDVKKNLDKLNKFGLNNMSNEQLLDLKMEIVSVKEELKEKEVHHLMVCEGTVLKKEIDEEIKSTANGKMKKDLAALKKAVDAAEKRTPYLAGYNDLLSAKKQFYDLKQTLVSRAEVIKTKNELALMKKMLLQQMHDNDDKTKKELYAMKKEVDGLQSKKLDLMYRDEFSKMKAKIGEIWKQMAEKEEALRVRGDLAALKQELDRDIRNVQGLQKNDVMAMKQTLEGIDLDDFDAKDQNGWKELKTELDAVKFDLKKKELVALKESLEEELKTPSDKIIKDIKLIKEASRDLNMLQLEAATISELINTKEKVDATLSKVSKSSLRPKKEKKGFFRSIFGHRGTKKTIKSTTTAAAKKSGGAVIAGKKKLPIITPPRSTGASVTSSHSGHSSHGNSSTEDEESNGSTPRKVMVKTYGNVTKRYGGNTASMKRQNVEIAFVSESAQQTTAQAQ